MPFLKGGESLVLQSGSNFFLVEDGGGTAFPDRREVLVEIQHLALRAGAPARSLEDLRQSLLKIPRPGRQPFGGGKGDSTVLKHLANLGMRAVKGEVAAQHILVRLQAKQRKILLNQRLLRHRTEMLQRSKGARYFEGIEVPVREIVPDRDVQRCQCIAFRGAPDSRPRGQAPDLPQRAQPAKTANHQELRVFAPKELDWMELAYLAQ